jgi:hypothetical protein
MNYQQRSRCSSAAIAKLASCCMLYALPVLPTDGTFPLLMLSCAMHTVATVYPQDTTGQHCTMPCITHTQEFDHALHVAEVCFNALCSSDDVGLGSHSYLQASRAMQTAMLVAAVIAPVS